MSAASETGALLRRRIAQVSELAPGSIGDMLHFELLDCDPEAGDYWLTCRTEDWMRNPAGTLHGGLGATVLDQAMGLIPYCLKTEAGTAPRRAAQCELPSSLDPGDGGAGKGACGFGDQEPDNPVSRSTVKGKPGKAVPVRYRSILLETGAMRCSNATAKK